MRTRGRPAPAITKMNEDYRMYRGFVIVRRGEWNWGRVQGSTESSRPSFRGVIYKGMDRMPWHDVLELRYSPEYDRDKQLSIGAILDKSVPPGCNLEMIADARDVFWLYGLLGDAAVRNEIIYVSESEDENPEDIVTSSLEKVFLGVDVINSFGLSLSAELWHRGRGDIVEDRMITEHGLLRNASEARRLAAKVQSNTDSWCFDMLEEFGPPLDARMLRLWAVAPSWQAVKSSVP